MWKRKLIFPWVLLTLVGIICSIYLLKPPLDDWCSGYLSSNPATTSIHPLKVVVEPLLGRHRVYGIFMLSIEKCPPGEPVLLRVSNAGNYCENAGFKGVFQELEGLEAPSGYYLTRNYMRTRTTLWLITQGLLDQLRQPRNWTLTYVPKN